MMKLLHMLTYINLFCMLSTTMMLLYLNSATNSISIQTPMYQNHFPKYGYDFLNRTDIKNRLYVSNPQCERYKRNSYIDSACAVRHPEVRVDVQRQGYSQFSDSHIETLTRNNFLVDDENRLILCYSGKAGATNVKSLIFHLTHRNSNISKRYDNESGILQAITEREQSIHALWPQAHGLSPLSVYSAQEIRRRLTSYYKVIVVRHPFARVLSFYNDKLRGDTDSMRTSAQTSCGPFQTGIGRHILRLYRESGLTPAERECGNTTTFPEFLRYFTTAEHGSFLLDNNHLEPLSRRCHPCQINYDQIIKLETGQADQLELLSNVYHFRDRQLAAQFLGSVPTHSSAHTEGAGYADKYTQVLYEYRNLTGAQFEALSRYYRDDLDLFGYTADMKGGYLSVNCNLKDRYSSCC